MSDLFGLENKIAVVTGASRGLGRAMALGWPASRANFDGRDVTVQMKSRSIRLAIGLLLLAGFSQSWTAAAGEPPTVDSQTPNSTPLAYGRFVPEREDDFAWENDKVAFRVYGPASRGQGPVSGVDAWFKKVEYPIIDKWYSEHLEGKSYHVDHGEGYDVYHVGASRGVGGTAIWVEGVPYPAASFKEYAVVNSGGERIEFTLFYEWETPLGMVTERKRVSLTLGSQLYRVHSAFTLGGDPASLPVAIGLTTHAGAAEVFASQELGRISTWETIDGHGVGTGALLDTGWTRGVLHIPNEEKKDASHIWLFTMSDESGALTYRAGFAWQAAGEITSVEKWNAYLDAVSGG